MKARFGIDASILLRLVTARPFTSYRAVTDRLISLVLETDASVVASNHVIGETYLVLRHHYGVEDRDAREAIRSVLTSGVVAAMGGLRVTSLLHAPTDQVVDRLIIDHYGRHGLRTLTQEAPVSRLDGALRLRHFIDPLDPILPD